MPKTETYSGPRSEWGILVCLFAIAWAVRFIGLDWGYFHGDERVNQAAKVLAGQLVPDQHFYPPLMHYIAAVVYGGLYAVGRVLNLWSSSAEFRAQYFQDPTIFYLTARALTGFIAALMAPLFYRIGRVLGFGKGESLVMAAFAILAPLSLLLSYIFKGDLGVATSIVWIVLLMIRKAQSPNLIRFDILIGVGVCLALSFKHSSILFLVPLAIAFLVVLGRTAGTGPTLRALARIVGVALLLWPALNIGIILDFEGFVKFQQIQTVMSVSDNGSLIDAIAKMLRASVSLHIGLGLAMPIAFLLFPALAIGMKRPGMLLGIWSATVAGLLVLAAIIGVRQPEQVWIAHFMIVQLFAAISLICLYRLSRPVGSALIVFALVISLIGDVSIWRQALVRPVHHDVAQIIKTRYSDRLVAVNFDVPLQKSRMSLELEADRTQRAADKYGVTLPTQAPERLALADSRESFNYVELPEVMFGLENSTDADMQGKVEPFAWPPQPEDWQLQPWLDQGFSIFVIRDFDGWITRDTALVMKPLFVAMNERCERIHEITARKPMFLERDVTILDCAGA